jgi:hypothetical protein
MIAATAAVIAVVVVAGVLYEFERPPALTNVTCRWRLGGVESAGDISNPSPWARSFGVEPRFTFQGMGEGTNSLHVYVSVPSHETRHWSVIIDMSRYRGHRITSCTPFAYGANQPED